MTHWSNGRWVRLLSIGIALLVPAAAMAAIVVFSNGQQLDAASLNGLSQRTLDKSRIYLELGDSNALAANGVGTATASCIESDSDILLNCSCVSGLAGDIDVRTTVVLDQDDATNPSRCSCTAQNLSAAGTVVQARATCIRVARP